MEKTKYPHMLTEVKNYRGVKLKSQGDVDSYNQGNDMCSNKIEFLALNESCLLGNSNLWS